MTDFAGRSEPENKPWSRRAFLASTATLAAGASLASGTSLARATPGQLALPGGRVGRSGPKVARKAIVIHLVGGPSQLETWDPKSNGAVDRRSMVGTCQTTVPGVTISELLPRMAQRLHQVALIRTLHHQGPLTHSAGLEAIQTGSPFLHGVAAPSIGSMVNYLCQTTPERPAAVTVGPLVAVDGGAACGHLTGSVSLDYLPPLVTSLNAVQTTVREALPACPDSYGRHSLGQKLWLARQLIQTQVALVTVNQFETVYDQVTWDMHANGNRLHSQLSDYRETLCPQLDQALSALLDDLSQTGELSETLVVVTGEMGRTARRNRHGGRDHQASAWTALMAGGPIPGGHVIGQTDREAEFPISRPVSTAEFVATIYSALGISASETSIPGPQGDLMPLLSALPVRELLGTPILA